MDFSSIFLIFHWFFSFFIDFLIFSFFMDFSHFHGFFSLGVSDKYWFFLLFEKVFFVFYWSYRTPRQSSLCLCLIVIYFGKITPSRNSNGSILSVSSLSSRRALELMDVSRRFRFKSWGESQTKRKEWIN